MVSTFSEKRIRAKVGMSSLKTNGQRRRRKIMERDGGSHRKDKKVKGLGKGKVKEAQ